MTKHLKIKNKDTRESRFHFKRQWKALTVALSVCVAVGTTAALMLPAITMSAPPCELEEHTHSLEQGCYSTGMETSLNCNYETLGVHRHTPDCFDGEQNELCGYSDKLLHTHDSFCFDANGELICSLPEMKEHRHSDECWSVTETVVEEGHAHEDSCWEWVTSAEPTCGIEESEGHSHGEGCVDADGALICGLDETSGHQHDESCFGSVQGGLICTEEEREPVIETGEPELTCEKEELIAHIHGDGCFFYDEEREEEILICSEIVVESHQHTDACFAEAETKTLICERPEHTHTSECVLPTECTCGTDGEDHAEDCPAYTVPITDADMLLEAMYRETTLRGLFDLGNENMEILLSFDNDYILAYEQWIATLTEQNSPLSQDEKNALEQLLDNVATLKENAGTADGRTTFEEGVRLSLSGASGSYSISGDEYNNWTVLERSTTSLAEFMNNYEMLRLNLGNVSVKDGSSLSIVTKNNLPLLRLNLGNIATADFENQAKTADGYTVSNAGSLKFSNAGMVMGQEVDVIVNFDTVNFSNSQAGTNNISGEALYREENNSYIQIGDFDMERFWISCLGSNVTEAQDYSSDNYAYPVQLYVECSFRVVYHDTDTRSNENLLFVAGDVDRFTNGLYEGISTISGFTGNYWIYDEVFTHNNALYSSGKGKVSLMETVNTPVSGDDSYYKAAYFAETDTTDTFTVAFHDLWCGTEVELYTTRSFSVVKDWKEDRDEVRPESIEVQLLGDDSEHGEPITLSAENNWRYTWKDLNPNVIYTVKETSNPANYTPSYTYYDFEGKVQNASDEDTSSVVITNTYAPPIVQLTVEKKIAGNTADMNAEFPFRVTYGAEGESSFDLGHNETCEAIDIPAGATVTITETNADGYRTSVSSTLPEMLDGQYDVASNSYTFTMPEKNVAVTFTNYAGVELPETGGAGTFPYILSGWAIIAVASMLIYRTERKKRKEAR